MISLNDITINYGKRMLFENLSLTIHRGERLGLVGPNGAGKTTLFSVVLKKIEPTYGNVQIKKGVRLGYLPQEAAFTSDRTVLEEAVKGDATIQALVKEKEGLEQTHKADTPRYGEILHELEVLEFFDLEHKAKKVLSGLGFKTTDFDRPVTNLSGGWQMRVLLAKLLTCHYDIVLLDEPTNFLDLNAALWFKDFLSGFKGTFVMISHDKTFLNEVTTGTLILEAGTLVKSKGHYDDYAHIREEKRQYLLRQFKEQEKKRKQLQQFINRFHGQPNKASQMRAKRKQIERMDEIVIPPDVRASIRTFTFPQTKRSGYRVLELHNIAKAYGDITVYQDFDFEILKGEKAVLVGENGAGKSTLLKILAGVAASDRGTRKVGHNVDIGYFSQTRMDVLYPDNTVFEEAFTVAPKHMVGETLRTILGIFLFSGDDVDKKVKVLSGGEKSRLILAKLLINPPNCLLLDEPTTHLDVDAVDALVKALKAYEGTLACISHDIHFVRSVANVVYHVEGGCVRKFPGDFDYYLRKKAQGDLVIPQPKKREKAAEAVEPVREEKESSAAQLKKERREYNSALAKKIKKLKKKRETLELDLYAKERVIDNPRHGEDVIRHYRMLVDEIKAQIAKVDTQINRFNTQFKK